MDLYIIIIIIDIHVVVIQFVTFNWWWLCFESFTIKSEIPFWFSKQPLFITFVCIPTPSFVHSFILISPDFASVNMHFAFGSHIDPFYNITLFFHINDTTMIINKSDALSIQDISATLDYLSGLRITIVIDSLI